MTTITNKLRTQAAQTHTRLIAATTTAYNAIAPMTTNPLTPAEQKILLIESKKFRHQGNKERRIYEAGFTFSRTRGVEPFMPNNLYGNPLPHLLLRNHPPLPQSITGTK